MMPEEERDFGLDPDEEFPWDVDQQTNSDEWGYEEEEDE